VGYELPQILLLHANRLNAMCLDRLFAMMQRRGYRYITLEQAMRDPAYARGDIYTGPAGITWLHRWALTDGRDRSIFAGEPDVPAFISEVSGISDPVPLSASLFDLNSRVPWSLSGSHKSAVSYAWPTQPTSSARRNDGGTASFGDGSRWRT
jgi:hypothetical protein